MFIWSKIVKDTGIFLSQMKINSSSTDQQKLHTLDKAFKSTAVNRTLSSLHWGSLELTRPVPLNPLNLNVSNWLTLKLDLSQLLSYLLNLIFFKYWYNAIILSCCMLRVWTLIGPRQCLAVWLDSSLGFAFHALVIIFIFHFLDLCI